MAIPLFWRYFSCSLSRAFFRGLSFLLYKYIAQHTYTPFTHTHPVFHTTPQNHSRISGLNRSITGEASYGAGFPLARHRASSPARYGGKVICHAMGP